MNGLLNILSPRPHLSPPPKKRDSSKKRTPATTVKDRRPIARAPPAPRRPYETSHETGPITRAAAVEAVPIKQVPTKLPEFSSQPLADAFEAPIVTPDSPPAEIVPLTSAPAASNSTDRLLPANEVFTSSRGSAANPLLIPQEPPWLWSPAPSSISGDELFLPAPEEPEPEDDLTVHHDQGQESPTEQEDDASDVTDDEGESLYVAVGSVRSRSSSIITTLENAKSRRPPAAYAFEPSDEVDDAHSLILDREDPLLKTFLSSDARLSTAIATLNSLQDMIESEGAMMDARSRRLAAFRRSSSLPNRQPSSSAGDVTPPTTTPPTSPRRRPIIPSSPSQSRARWLVSIIHMSPSLPSVHNLASDVELYNHNQRPALRHALAEVQSAQSHLLNCLSKWASNLIQLRLAQNPEVAGDNLVSYKERIVFLSQAIVCGYLTDKLMSRLCLKEDDPSLERLKQTASSMGDALEGLRDVIRDWALLGEGKSPPSSAPTTPKKNKSSGSVFKRSHSELEIPASDRARKMSTGSTATITPVAQDDVLTALTRFDEQYHRFGQQLVSSHVSASEKRRLRRTKRLYSRMQRACETLSLPKEALQVPPSTHLLVDFTIRQAIVSSLLESEDDTCELSPKLFVVIPRLCIMYGITEATLPTGWEDQAPFDSELFIDHFFPRIDRVLPLETIIAIRRLSLSDRGQLEQMLTGNVGEEEGPELVGLHRAICTGADESSQGSEAKRWAQIMKESLRAFESGSEEALPTPEDVARDLSASVIS